MQAMKGATMALGSMNKTMNLPSLQRIAMEFERENDLMEQRQEMMDDAVDDAMDVGEEEEGDEIVEQVLEEIGVDLNQAVSGNPLFLTFSQRTCSNKSYLVRRDPKRATVTYSTGNKSCPSRRGWGWGSRRRRSASKAR